MWKKTLIHAVTVLSLTGLATAQTQTGTITGTVTDSQGAVLPGVSVTISSPALISSRTDTTGAGGAYLFTAARPGVYTILYELSGFQSLSREGIRITVARTTTVTVELQISGVEEVVTVTGESPVVDVKNTVQSTNIEKELFDAIPTGRNPWVMAGLVPGMVTGRLDVGGNNGMQQYGMEVFGSSTSHTTFSIDGLKVNWPGGSGGFTMQYYDFGMYEEYNFQTSTQSAESDVAGVYMNMVTKSGGNDFSGDAVIYFENDALQAEGGSGSGNPIDKSYDFNTTIGGPIARDKAWFFSSLRWWRLDQFQLGAFNPDGSQALDDNRIRNLMGKVTYQITDRDNVAVMAQKNWKDRFHRRNSPYLFVADPFTIIQDQPAHNVVVTYNRIVNDAVFLDFRGGRMWGTTPARYQDGVNVCGTQCGPNDVSTRDAVRFTVLNAPFNNNLNPNSRNQFNGSLSWFLDQANSQHNFKFGVQVSREEMNNERIRNGDVVAELSDGVPDRVLIYNSPFTSVERTNTWAAYAQDNWTIGQRLTVNLGVRLDGIQGFVPEQTSSAGTFIGERSFARQEGLPDWPINAGPRLGFSYDLFGNGRTALKGGWGRYYTQMGTELSARANPNGESVDNAEWLDLNGNLLLDPGPSGSYADSPEIGTRQGFGEGGISTVYDRDSSRPYSDDISLGIDHTLRDNLSLSATYHRRQHRGALGTFNEARPASAYDPMQVDYVDPFDGPQTITVFNLQPAFVGAQGSVIRDADFLQSDYNGVAIQLQKRMSNNWQLLTGLTLSTHQGFFHDTPFNGTDFENPNNRINRDDASVFTEVPVVFNLSGSYLLPAGLEFAGNYRARSGDPVRRRLRVSGLNQGTDTIEAAPRGTDRTDAVTQLLDLRIAKRFNLGGNATIQGSVDFFNILNADHIRAQRDTIGSTFGNPSRILSPRIIRVGAKISF